MELYHMKLMNKETMDLKESNDVYIECLDGINGIEKKCNYT